MTPQDHHLLHQTRRHFFAQCGVGLGSMALASLIGKAADAKPIDERVRNPLSVWPPHYAAKAKSVIFLFMAGGPSQLELFENKPKLKEMDGQVVPPSYTEKKRFAFIKGDAKLL